MQLANQAQRLVVSDVAWTTCSARRRSPRRARRRVRCGRARFELRAEPEFGSRVLGPGLERVNGAATSDETTPEGCTERDPQVQALPGGTAPSTDVENIVTAGNDLGFAVIVEDTGDNQEVQVKVTRTIDQQPAPLSPPR